jgi:hypothetical protein
MCLIPQERHKLLLVSYSCYLVTKVKEGCESQQCPRYKPKVQDGS